MEIYRTFIAIPMKVDPSFLEERSRLIHELQGERISWVVPENFHLTMRFLGNTSEDRIQGISGAMEEALELPRPSSLELHGLGTFGSRGRPSILWVGIREAVFLQELKLALDQILHPFGFSSEGKGFRPHLTLGRIRSLENKEEFFRMLEMRSPDFQGTSRADRLVFFKSELKSTGAVYRPLGTFPFGD